MGTFHQGSILVRFTTWPPYTFEHLYCIVYFLNAPLSISNWSNMTWPFWYFISIWKSNRFGIPLLFRNRKMYEKKSNWRFQEFFYLCTLGTEKNVDEGRNMQKLLCKLILSSTCKVYTFSKKSKFESNLFVYNIYLRILLVGYKFCVHIEMEM